MKTGAEFIEKFGMVAEQDGFPRIAGRMMAFLLLNEGPYTLDELAEELQISKTSASTNARLLEQLGVIDRAIKAGDRHDFYQLSENHWEKMVDVAMKRMERFHDVLTKTIACLPPTEEYGRKRLVEAQRFHAFILERLGDHIEEWRRNAPAEVK